jgi:type I restriction enzyme S subunit
MGTVGRCCVVTDDISKALSSKHLWTMTFDTELVIPELVCWQLNHANWVKDWFARYSQGAVMEAIQSSTLRTLRLPIPSIEEQKKILDRYLNTNQAIETEEEIVSKLRQQKGGLMHDLLTGRGMVHCSESREGCCAG